MSNMSYCRFRNTLNDFDDCASKVEEIINGDVDEALSREEFIAAVRLVQAAADLIDIVKDAAGVDAEDDLTREQIEKLLTVKE